MCSKWIRTISLLGFCAFVLAVYLFGAGKRNRMIEELEMRAHALQQKKELALQEKEELSLILASESDPSWIELVLLRELGVVPEGFLKVHFKK